MTPTTAGTSGRERRVVRIIGELKESRIVDVGELTDPRLIYGKILQKFDIVRDRTDLATIEREMERWVLVLPGAGAEGDKPVTAQELVALGVTPNILNPRDTESIPKLYLRKRNHAPAYSTLTTKDLQRKMAKVVQRVVSILSMILSITMHYPAGELLWHASEFTVTWSNNTIFVWKQTRLHTTLWRRTHGLVRS